MKGTGSSVCEVFSAPYGVWSLCDCKAHIMYLCACAHVDSYVYMCGCVHALCHDGECSTTSVMLRGTRTLVAVVTVEPDDMQAGQ